MFSQTFTGIIIKVTHFQEADKIVTVFCKELGKAQFIAKGVRKQMSKTSGVVDLFVDGVFEVTNKQQLPTLIQAQLNTWYPYLRTSLAHWQYAERAAKALLRATKEHDPHQELYFLFKDFLEKGAEEAVPQWWWLQFLWKLLYLSGFGINISHCIACGELLTVERVGNKSVTYEGFRCHDCALKSEKSDQALYAVLTALDGGLMAANNALLNTVQQYLEDALMYHFV